MEQRVISGNALSANLAHLSRAGLGAPLFIVILLSMTVIPLAPFLLDLFFTFNITLALIVLLAVIYSKRPLDFAIFPTVLLVATLLRLSLNVASTRIVLLNGHTGPDSAGKVIQAFGDFVVGGNYAVGFVVFTILVIINFVVVTKGGGRISEVSARFTLDAMPGKQMAIDADLNSGLIGQDEAKLRRAEIAQEADFYGAMDGASKFVRGDAIAGIMILAINILGGLTIGILQHDLAITDAAHIYTLLTIGDGLVAQIPSLLLSTAAAIMVTRVSREEDMSQQIISQLFQSPKILTVSAAVIGLIGLIPGMPNIAFLLLAVIVGIAAYWLYKKQQESNQQEQKEITTPKQEERELGWDDVEMVDEVGLEVGYRLIPMVDRSQSGQLLARIKSVRKKLSQELGFLFPVIHVRDNLDLEPNEYRITIKDSTVGRSQIHPDKELAINPGQVFGELSGITAQDPVFGLEATWIESGLSEQARSYGYTVVNSSTVIATHMSQVLQNHAHELVGHKEVQALLDRYSSISPKIIDDIIPKRIPFGTIVTILKNLLRENIPIRDIKTIIETITLYAPHTQEADTLTSVIRIALGRLIVEKITGDKPEIQVSILDASLEQLLLKIIKQSTTEGPAVIEPGLAQRLVKEIQGFCERQEVIGKETVLLVTDNLREMLARFFRNRLPRLNVLSFSEIPESAQIKIVATIGEKTD